MRPHQILGIIIAGILALLLVFACVDCASGTTRHFECHITGHHYVPPRTETQMTTDSDGDISFHTVHHPEEFHLLCAEHGGIAQFDIQVPRARYHAITNGQDVTVKTRQGKWTGANWMPYIVD
jgi:hypothetical protein